MYEKGEIQMSLKGKLNRLKKHMAIENTQEELKQREQEENHIEIPYLEKWLSFGAKPFFFENSYCLVREVSYPLDDQYGRYRFSQLATVVEAWQKSHFAHPLSAKGLQTGDMFFFDTETTGLGGGAGNTIFLLGHANVTDQEVIVKQHFLAVPEGEAALYQSFLTSVDYTTLVTYNGKAFDWPQVKTRHTLLRDTVPKLPAFGHFDLYHASRRIWKQRLESVRLSHVEKEILQIHRENDTPGFLAPMIYFDFLENKDPEGIFTVIRHNELDVLSLIILYIHLSTLVLNPTKCADDSERFEIAKWFDYIGETHAAFESYKEIVNTDKLESIKAKMALAKIYKKQRKWNEATTLWKDVLQSGSVYAVVDAGIELAKAYEHYLKDYKGALYYAEYAYSQWKSQIKMTKNPIQTEMEEEFVKRITRLKKKLK
jgi:uncharacterized protein